MDISGVEWVNDPRVIARMPNTFLDENKSPTRRVGGIDNRGSHYYLAHYWAQELATQTDDPTLADSFTNIAKQLTDHETTITAELLAVQGSPADIGGYYRPDDTKATAVMTPSTTLNSVLAQLAD